MPITAGRAVVGALFVGSMVAFLTPLCYRVLVPNPNPFTRCGGGAAQPPLAWRKAEKYRSHS